MNMLRLKISVLYVAFELQVPQRELPQNRLAIENTAQEISKRKHKEVQKSPRTFQILGPHFLQCVQYVQVQKTNALIGSHTHYSC